MAKQYVIDDDYTVCTEGAMQSPIVVNSHHKVCSRKKFVATSEDRMKRNYNCLKMLSAGVTLGGIAGGIVCAAAAASVGGLGLAVVGLVGGGIRGSIRGNVVGKLISIIPCICACLTKLSSWSSMHERVKICGNNALMPDAKLNCLFGGLISIIKPDWGIVTDMAKLSYFAYDSHHPTYLPDGELKNELEANGEILPSRYEKLTDKDKLEEIGIIIDIDVFERNDDLQNDDSGFNAQVYRKKKENADDFTKEKDKYDYVLVFTGTDEDKEWVNPDITQGAGLPTSQYKQAITTATKLEDGVPNSELTITGHSLGGGLATAAGVVTGCETYAYNPAGVNQLTYLWNRDFKNFTNPNTSKIHTIYAETDPLNFANNNLAVMPDSSGERICISTDNEFEFSFGFIERGHDLPFLIKALSEKNDSSKGKVVANHD